MTQEIYADKISNIYVNGPIVRIDFISLNPAQTNPADNPAHGQTTRIVMPLTGFAEAFALHQDIINQLTQRGVIAITPPAAAPKTAPAAPNTAATAGSHEK